MKFLLVLVFLFAVALALIVVYAVMDRIAQRRKECREYDAEMLRERID